MGQRKGRRATELESSAVIDASTFASSYNAFWGEAAPTLEHFIRHLNLRHLERFEVPVNGNKSGRRAVVAEYAFSIFYEHWADRENVKAADQKSKEAWIQMERRLKPFLGKGISLENPLNEDEENEVFKLSRRLQRFFAGPLYPTEVRPVLPGCGFVDASEADVLVASTLFEVKTVNRSFRSVDVRQLIAYAALNHSSRQLEIEEIGLINPRMGVVFQMPLEEVSREISGRSAEELLSVVVHAFSSGDISR